MKRIIQHAFTLLGSLLIGAAALGLGGCASPASRTAMSAPAVQYNQHHPHSVTVQVQGGTDTGALDSSNIANADLKAAIEDSIAASRLFTSVIQGKGGDYELSVIIIQLSKPLFGGSFTVDMEAGWSLVRASDKQVVLRKTIKTSHTATMSDSVVGVTRLRMAVEGAARRNVEAGLRAVAALQL
jgi:hypothetical protein